MFLNTRDNLIVLFVFVVSGGFFFFNYDSLVEQIDTEGLLVSDIKKGSSVLFIENGTNCVGTVRVTTEELDLLKLLVEFEVDVLLSDKPEKVGLEVEIYFNPLGQLVGGQIALDSRGVEYFVRIEGVNPIHLRTLGASDRLKKKINIPGPLEIRFNKDRQSYQIIYPHLPMLANKLPVNTDSPLKSLGLILREEKSCRADMPYDLRAMIMSMRAMNFDLAEEKTWSK